MAAALDDIAVALVRESGRTLGRALLRERRAQAHRAPRGEEEQGYGETRLEALRRYDGGADDNFFLHFFPDVQSYTDRNYGVCLEWNYTEGRAKQVIEYMKNVLQNTTSIELWHVWLIDYYELEDRPVIHRQTISIDELTAKHIKEIDDAEIWNTPDKMYPNRPSFYCLEIKR